MEIQIIRNQITRKLLADIASQQFGDLVKAVVDVEREVMAIGGELHSDEEAALIADGSQQLNLWGINFYPAATGDGWIEFDSMINVRPSQNNRSRGVEDPTIQAEIRAIAEKLIK
jgi:hypothetical protein